MPEPCVCDDVADVCALVCACVLAPAWPIMHSYHQLTAPHQLTAHSPATAHPGRHEAALACACSCHSNGVLGTGACGDGVRGTGASGDGVLGTGACDDGVRSGRSFSTEPTLLETVSQVQQFKIQCSNVYNVHPHQWTPSTHLEQMLCCGRHVHALDTGRPDTPRICSCTVMPHTQAHTQTHTNALKQLSANAPPNQAATPHQTGLVAQHHTHTSCLRRRCPQSLS